MPDSFFAVLLGSGSSARGADYLGAISFGAPASEQLRALQSALRVELRAHHATEEKWRFLATGPLGPKYRRIKIQPKRPRPRN